ncbi:SIMPL domain-containing protein [Bisgaard Taxon 45]|uniref:SIMPL domain-containing protein n=1 Tax=Bisgaard Taxon 45 TaxID=304289 RepID=A0ABT9KDI7_9PAST|nr:SIMPL domain-containing protein [Bisgaard Taxon 45]
MTFKHLAWILLALPVVLNAQPVDNKLQHNQVQFSAEVVKEIDKDEMQVILYLQEEGKEASALNQVIVARMNQALEAVKKHNAVQVVSQQRYTQVRYSKEGRQIGWIDRAELVLKSQDMPMLSTLVAELNEHFKIGGMYATVSEESLARVEKEMTEAVLHKFEQKAQLIQSLMKAKGYRLIELDLSPQDVMGSTRSYAVSMKSTDAFYSASSEHEMALEGGKTKLRTVVQAKIELIND